MGPRGVSAQCMERMSSPISPPPTSQSVCGVTPTRCPLLLLRFEEPVIDPILKTRVLGANVSVSRHYGSLLTHL